MAVGGVVLALLVTMSFAEASDNAARDGAVVALGTTATTVVSAFGGAAVGSIAGFVFCPNDCVWKGDDEYAAPWAGLFLGGLVGANIGAAGGAAGFSQVTGRRPAVPAIVAGTTFAGWTALSIGVGAFEENLLGPPAGPTEELLALGGMALLPGIAAGIAVASTSSQQRVVVRPAPTRAFGPGWVVAGTF